MCGHSHSVTRQVIASGSSSWVLASSCSRTSSATQSASGVSVTTSGGKKAGPREAAHEWARQLVDALPAAGGHGEVLDRWAVAAGRRRPPSPRSRRSRTWGRPGRSCSPRRSGRGRRPRGRPWQRFGRAGAGAPTARARSGPPGRWPPWRRPRPRSRRRRRARLVAVSFNRGPEPLRGRWMPGVSTKTTCASRSWCSTPRIR